MPPLTEREMALEPETSAAAGMAAPESTEPAPLGLALSGGGVRAALFSLGVIIGLIETQCHHRLRCIASVSGGSILNAALAHAGKLTNFSTVDAFTPLAKALATRLAWRGAFAFAFDWRSALSGLWYTGQIVLRAAVPALFGLAYLADRVREEWNFDVANLDFSSVPWMAVLWVASGSLVLSLLLSRGLLQEAKFTSVLGCIGSTTPGKLLVEDWGKIPKEESTGVTHANRESTGVIHVLVATDLLSGEPMYFSGEFVHCKPYGWSKPEQIRTAEALYSSAAFPAVFPPKRLKLSRLKFQNGEMSGDLPRSVRLADGGVYNNLGTDWFDVLSEQWRTSKPLLWPFGALPLKPPAIDKMNVIVVNASAPSRRVRWLLPFPISRIMSVLYDNTVRPRVRSMRRENRPLIDIDNSPLELAKHLALLDGEAGARATKLVTKLEGMTDQFWADFKSDAAGTRTKLSRAGERTAARLMLHGYLLSLVLLHVRFGAALPEQIRGEEYFLSLVPRPWLWQSPAAASTSSPGQ